MEQILKLLKFELGYIRFKNSYIKSISEQSEENLNFNLQEKIKYIHVWAFDLTGKVGRGQFKFMAQYRCLSWAVIGSNKSALSSKWQRLSQNGFHRWTKEALLRVTVQIYKTLKQCLIWQHYRLYSNNAFFLDVFLQL